MLDKAIKILKERGCNCVVIKENKIYTSTKKGINPLLDWIDEGLDFNDAVIADKIIGKALASLIIKAGIKSAFAITMSKAGKQKLEDNKIEYKYDVLVDKIINRTGDDECPMELTVKNIENVDEAYIALKRKVTELKNNK